MPDLQPDLLAPLLPGLADAARPGGTIRGPADWRDGFGAGLECWVPRRGLWTPLGELVGAGSGPIVGGLMLHQGRLTVGLAWNLGYLPIRERATDA